MWSKSIIGLHEWSHQSTRSPYVCKGNKHERLVTSATSRPLDLDLGHWYCTIVVHWSWKEDLSPFRHFRHRPPLPPNPPLPPTTPEVSPLAPFHLVSGPCGPWGCVEVVSPGSATSASSATSAVSTNLWPWKLVLDPDSTGCSPTTG